jgi:hypothetical protein
MSWGDMSKPRPTTEDYRNNFDKIFGKKKNDKTGRIPGGEPSSVAAGASASDRQGARSPKTER